MTQLLGIDLGTSSVKALVINEGGHTLSSAACEYPIDTPHPDHAEQNPEAWWDAAVQAVRAALNQLVRPDIAAIGLSGQMHGLVMVDAAGRPLRPAIIWPDRRSVAQVEQMIAPFGAERFAAIAGTLPATGFMGPSLLWLAEYEPHRLDITHAILCPKDYVRHKLTGTINAEVSDASATALFDISQRTWSHDIIAACKLPMPIFPPVLESTVIAGSLLPEAAQLFGLPSGLPVIAGCADQAAQAVGNGLFDAGSGAMAGAITIGSGGQVFVLLDAPRVDAHLHTFCHAVPGCWYMLGAMLTAGLSLRWLRDLLGLRYDEAAYDRLSAEARQISPGAAGLMFLPYLAGERAPLLDPLASGVFVGLSLQHQRGHLARAIMEGVAFALRQIIELMEAQGAQVGHWLAAGNGLASPVWRQITADSLNRPLHLSPAGEHTARGAALLAGVGVGMYSYDDLRALAALPSVAVTEPDPRRTAFYDERYALFTHMYPTLKATMHSLKSSRD